MSHTCHARDCETPCRPELLMCPKHWRKVSSRIQADVYARYRRGQCDDGNPSRAWHDAASAAIAYVACREGKGTTKREAQALAAYGGTEKELLITTTMKRLGVEREIVLRSLGE